MKFSAHLFNPFAEENVYPGSMILATKKTNKKKPIKMFMTLC